MKAMKYFGWLWIIAATPVMGEDRSYFYRLDLNKSSQVCRHMKGVFNKTFRQPWMHQESALKDFSSDLPKAFADPQNLKQRDILVRDMLYSGFPSTPEFKAIQWKLGWVRVGTTDIDVPHLYPFLIAYFDIDNDGTIDTVLKTEFMSNFVYRGGWNNDPGADRLQIYLGEQVSFDAPPRANDLWAGKHSGTSPVSFQYYRTLRPFLFEGVTYIASYEPLWKEEIPSPHSSFYPAKEYMRIFKYGGGSYSPEFGNANVKMELICLFRMMPRTSSREGN